MANFYAGCREGYVRLAGGRNSLEGRIEVCHDGVWGTVCNNHWEREDASVACRQLGHAHSGKYILFLIWLTSLHSLTSHLIVFM